MDSHEDIRSLKLTLSVVEAHTIALGVDRLLEPILGNGIAEVHVDSQRDEPGGGA